MKTRLFLTAATAIFLNGAISFSQTINDTEIKTNVSPIVSATSNIQKLNPVSFQYNNEKYSNLKLESGTKYGFLTENVESVFPELVYSKSLFHDFGKNNYRKTQIKSVEYESLIPVLVAAIKELKNEIDLLKTQGAECSTHR